MQSKIHQFTLVLKNVNEATANIEDSLYEAGCNDALINFRNGTVFLDFDRKSSSFEEAVLSAIKDVENSSVKAMVENVSPDNFVTEAEIAKRLNVGRQAVSLWAKGQRRKSKTLSFPNPVMKLSDKSPFWKWREVVEWLYDDGFLKDEEIVKNARIIEAINVILSEVDPTFEKYRKDLSVRIKNQRVNSLEKEEESIKSTLTLIDNCNRAVKTNVVSMPAQSSRVEPRMTASVARKTASMARKERRSHAARAKKPSSTVVKSKVGNASKKKAIMKKKKEKTSKIIAKAKKRIVTKAVTRTSSRKARHKRIRKRG